jgi:hypothetical protein
MMPETTIDRATPVFVARALTKIYQMGEVRVDAFRGIDFDLELGHQTGQEARSRIGPVRRHACRPSPGITR